MSSSLTTICNSAPSEFLAELALSHRDELIERSVRTILDNLALVDAFFERHRDTFSWERPKAGPIGFPRLLSGDVEAFCEGLVREAGVLLLPGHVFEDRDNHFRIGFGRRGTAEALVRLEAHLDRYSAEAFYDALTVRSRQG
jgi:aspartate/methionine/tyrosine aminotransferase